MNMVTLDTYENSYSLEYMVIHIAHMKIVTHFNMLTHTKIVAHMKIASHI